MENSQGFDDRGTKYPSIDQMWEMELNAQSSANVIDKVGSVTSWYNNANQYWSNTQATNDGVLGGYGNLSEKDISYSLHFMINIFKENPQMQRNAVIDCGAGIGRISKSLLCQLYKTVDIIDQCQKFIEKAKQILFDKKIRHFYCQGLQEFKFKQKYDCVWIQWVLSHLTDVAAIEFFKRAKESLSPNGIIILKQNHCSSGFVVDKQDYSVTRSTQLYKKLFSQAKLQIVKEEEQKNWPQDLFRVRIYALR